MKIAQLLALSFCLTALAPAVDAVAVGLPRSSPEAQGISSSAILHFVEAATASVDSLHTLMVVRHGQVVAEGAWSPYSTKEPQALFSVSKSFTATAVGLAIAEGKLSLDDPLLKFFPEGAPANPGKNLQAMLLRDLLTMSTGHHDDTLQPFPYGAPVDLVKIFLALPVAHKPGTSFVYNTPASYMLSAIVQQVTGQSVLEYLRPRLFEPLEIGTATWEASAQGVSFGGFGLSLRIEDVAKFGQLHLQRGQWQGQQIISSSWVDEATSRLMSNGSDPKSDWEQGYGYQFWRCRHGFYRADGAFGQFCIVMPQYDAVIAITSGTANPQLVMDLIWEKLVPAFESTPLAENTIAREILTAKLQKLALPRPFGNATSELAATLSGKRYTFPKNELGLDAIALCVSPNGSHVFTLRLAGVDQQIPVVHGQWSKAMFTTEGASTPIAAAGAWTAIDQYTLKICRYLTPFVRTYRLNFSADLLRVETEENVGLGELKVAEFLGKAE